MQKHGERGGAVVAGSVQEWQADLLFLVHRRDLSHSQTVASRWQRGQFGLGGRELEQKGAARVENFALATVPGPGRPHEHGCNLQIYMKLQRFAGRRICLAFDLPQVYTSHRSSPPKRLERTKFSQFTTPQPDLTARKPPL